MKLDRKSDVAQALFKLEPGRRLDLACENQTKIDGVDIAISSDQAQANRIDLPCDDQTRADRQTVKAQIRLNRADR